MQLRPRKKSFWKRVSLVVRHCLSLGATVLTISGITRASVQAQPTETVKKSCDPLTKGTAMSFDSADIVNYYSDGYMAGIIDERPNGNGLEVDVVEKSFFEQIKSILLTDKEFLLRKGKKKSQEEKNN